MRLDIGNFVLRSIKQLNSEATHHFATVAVTEPLFKFIQVVD